MIKKCILKAGYLKYDMLEWFSIPGQKLRE